LVAALGSLYYGGELQELFDVLHLIIDALLDLTLDVLHLIIDAWLQLILSDRRSDRRSGRCSGRCGGGCGGRVDLTLAVVGEVTGYLRLAVFCDCRVNRRPSRRLLPSPLPSLPATPLGLTLCLLRSRLSSPPL
jgi:hypothetical protein